MLILSEQDSLNRLLAFLQEWSRLNEEHDELYNHLSKFLGNWNRLAGNLEVEVAATVKEINLTQLQSFIAGMTPLIPAIIAERRNGNAANVWGVTGLKRDEVRISSVLAWFLNYHGDHGQKSALLSGLLKTIKNMPENFPLPEDLAYAPYWVNVESCPSGDKSSRVDIEIEGDRFLLFIEVKIDAAETNNQLDRYLEIGEKKSGNRPWGVVFLTPSGCKPKVSTIAKEHSRLVCISWEDISKVLKGHAELLPPCFSQSLLFQFSKYISNF